MSWRRLLQGRGHHAAVRPQGHAASRPA